MDSQGCCASFSLQPLSFSTVDEPTKTQHQICDQKYVWVSHLEVNSQRIKPQTARFPLFHETVSRLRSTDDSHIHNREHLTNAFWLCLAQWCNLHPQSLIHLLSFSIIFFFPQTATLFGLALCIINIHTRFSTLMCVGLFPFDLGGLLQA